MDVSAGFGSLTEEIESTKDFVSFGKDWIKKHISANVNNLVMFTVRGNSIDGGNSRTTCPAYNQIIKIQKDGTQI